MEKLDTAQKVIARSNDLKKFWLPRNDKMKSWYKLIQMVDELKQPNMESFVGNDPRASYNLILSMLEQEIPHRITNENLTPEQVSPAGDLGDMFTIAWKDIFARYRGRGRNFLRDFIGLFIATGWYSVFSTISLDGTKCIAEILHPASVFPNWEQEMIECSHIFSLTPLEAHRMATRAGWNTELLPRTKTTCYDYWMLDDNGDVFNSVAIGTYLAKPLTPEVKFKQIPIFVSPAGGLPDWGLLSDDTSRWKEEFGQSVNATNENIYKAWNKWWTFSSQLLRDTAQPRWIEKSTSSVRIVKPEEVFKWGAIFKMGPQDSFEAVHMPPIPVELRSSQLDMEAMMQRGGPSWAVFGNVQQQLSAYVMSQISASLRNITKPFHEGIINMFSDIDNFWLGMMRDFNYKPYGREIPKELPTDLLMSADYEIRIPGDIIQRATAARMLDPGFEISPVRIMKELFPEIKNPMKELADIRAAKAERHPVRALITLIESFRQEAALLEKLGDSEGARLYNMAADKSESMLGIAEEQAGAPPGAPGARSEAVPPPSPMPPVS